MMTYTNGFRCCHEAPSPALVDSFQEQELFVLSSVWLWIQRIQKSDPIILLQPLTRPLLPLRVTAKSQQEALVSQPSLGPQHLPSSPMLTAGEQASCRLRASASVPSAWNVLPPDTHTAPLLMSFQPLLKYHFLNDTLPQAAYLNCTCSRPQHSLILRAA